MSIARKLLPSTIAEHDLLWQKFLAAPFDSEPAPEQERDGLAAAKAGRFVDGGTVSAEIARLSRAKTPTRAR